MTRARPDRTGIDDRPTIAQGTRDIARPGPAAVPPIPSTWTAGTITYYGKATTGGACLASSVPANKYTVALGPSEYAGEAACGTYVDIKGARGTIRAKVTTLCPECSRGHLDLTNEAFAALDALAKGQTSVTYRAGTRASPRHGAGQGRFEPPLADTLPTAHRPLHGTPRDPQDTLRRNDLSVPSSSGIAIQTSSAVPIRSQ
jgi:hypothetical protein